VVHGRIFQTIDEVRDAVRAFVVRYNAEWLIEKNGHRSPLDARAAWLDRPSGAPRSATHCPESRVRYMGRIEGMRDIKIAIPVQKGNQSPELSVR
jgi:hypothetical protein